MSTAPVQLSEIKDRLVGLDQWFEAAARSKSQYDDNKIVSLIPSWIRKFERETQFRVNPVQIVSAPDGTYDAGIPGTGTVQSVGNKVTGTGTAFLSTFQPGQLIGVGTVALSILSIENDTHLTMEKAGPTWPAGTAYTKFALPVVKEFGYPYYPPDAQEYFRTTFRERPVQSIQRFRILYNGRQLVYNLPPEWFSLDTRSGKFYLLPYSGQAIQVGAMTGLALYSVIMADHVPNILFFDYQAGLPDGWQYSHEWSDILLVLSEYCALQVLYDIAHSIGAGLTNKQVSGTGISQNFNYDRFNSRKQELEASVKVFADNWVAQETPFMMATI